jgi:HSP20 family protein
MFFSPARAHRATLNAYGFAPHIWSRFEAFDASEQRAQIESDDTTITLILDVPGLSKEQLTIGVEGRIVRITSKDDAPRSLHATYKLGSDVDAAQSEAKLENGVLTLKFAKIAPESRQTLLTIN